MRGSPSWLGFVNDIPLTGKLLIIYLFCVLLPILTVNLLFFLQMSDNIRTRDEINLNLTLDRAAMNVADIIVGAVALSHSVATDQGLYEDMDRDYPDLIAFYDQFADGLRTKMKPYLSAYTHVEHIAIYTENPFIANGGNYFILDDKVKASQWYEAVASSGAPLNVLVYTDVDPINKDANKEYLSIVRRLKEFPLYDRYTKYLKIDIKTSSVEAVLAQERNYLDLWIVDRAGDVLFPYQARIGNREDIRQNAGNLLEKELGTASYIQGWTMLGRADDSLFKAALQDAKRFIWTIAAVSMLVPTSFILIMLRSYNYRIKRLSRHMDKTRNEKFDPILLPEGKDEIGGLIRSFNRMASTIESLINDVYKLEIKQKDMQLGQIKAELNLLQSQMNPHFLFNTLNALLVVSMKNGYGEVTDIIRDLSQLLRRMLGSSDDLVHVEEELRFTETYLKIEKFRFKDRFSYGIDTGDATLACLIPKMSIQPLVENACKHGLQSVRGQRHIHIEAKIKDGFLLVRVRDNGQGMSRERLAFIRDQINRAVNTGENIGLHNVFTRLRLHYGDRVDLFIDSQSETGTSVGFRIPAKLAEEGGDGHVFRSVGG